MSLESRLTAFVQAVGTDIKALQQSSGGGGSQSVTFINTSRQLTTSETLVESTGTVVLTLPAANSVTVGKDYTIYHGGQGGRLTVQSAEGTANVIGRLTHVLDEKETVTLFSTGSAWWARSDSIGDVVNLVGEYGNTTPMVPANGLTIFTRKRARRVLAFVGPSGMDTQVQPAFFSNRISSMMANPTQAAPTMMAITPTNNAAPTAVTPTAPSAAAGLGGSVHRHRYSTAATTAGSAAGFRIQGQHLYMTNVANAGGFFVVMRWVTGSNINRMAFGVQGATAAIPFSADTRGAIANFIGFSKNQNDQQMWLFTSAANAANYTTVATGIAPTIANGLYEARLFCPSGQGQDVFWSLQEFTTNVYAEGVLNTSNTMPNNNSPLFVHMEASNGATTGTGYFDLQSLYIETDN